MQLNSMQEAALRWRKCPTTFDRQVFGIEEFDEWELEADRLHASNKFLAISSGRGVGKTHYLARRIWRHQLSFFPALSFCSGPKRETIKDGLMPALSFWHQRLPPFFRAMFTLGTDTITMNGSPQQNMVLLRTTAQHNPDGLKGPRLHHMLVCGDEYSGISEEVHKRLTGFLTTKYGRFIATSQPTMLSGPFHRMFHKRGIGYKTMNVSSLDSRHVDHDYVKSVVREFGKDSDEYRIDVLGLFPLESSSTLIPMDAIKASMARERKDEITRPVWGYDHAEGGGDKCALATLITIRSLDAPLFLYPSSASLPAGLYMRSFEKVRVGSIVAFPAPAVARRYQERDGSYVPSAYLFIKPVAAGPGDWVCNDPVNGLEISGVWLAPVAKTDSRGRMLPMRQFCRRLRSGEFFMFSDTVSNSFDSRYFGIVERKHIIFPPI